MNIFGKTGLAATAVVSLLAVTPAHAVTFAEFGATSNFDNIQWTQSSSLTSGTLSTTGAGASADVTFSYLTPSLLGLANLPALFTFSGSPPPVTPALNLAGHLFQEGLSGSFSFTYTGPSGTIGGHAITNGANLLSGTFGGGYISGKTNSTAGNVDDATSSGGVLGFTSDFLTFQTTGNRSYSFSLTSIADPLNAAPGQSLDSFGAVATGSFEADIGNGGGQGGIPEPSTWALMILGLGGMGMVLRRRKTVEA